ncbi:MAG: histone deacetylase family protein, partial [Steroidobacteraceae bacterium]
ADEKGRGAGAGFNLNVPLAHGSGDPVFLAAVQRALEHIEAFAPSGLVVALGLDASEHDPIGALKVTTQGFANAGEAIAGLRVPTAIVQEGGYLCPALPANLVAFLRQFAKTRR